MTVFKTIFKSIENILPVFSFSRPVGLILMAVGVLFIFFGLCLLFSRKKKKSEAAVKDIEIYSKSIIGDRNYQQDYCIFPKNIQTDQIRNVGLLAVVCDGMGGMEGGERASSCCAETVYSGYYQTGSTDNICGLLKGLITEANKEVAAFTAENGRKLNSGTTIVAAAYLDSKIFWASAGDSRIYLYHNGELTQITRDHNLRQKLLAEMEEGLISREQFDAARQKEALTSYVGMGQNIIIDTGELSFPKGAGNVLLLCSDGIYKTASDDTIREIIEKTKSAEELPDALIAAAMAGGRQGKHDNISAIVIKRN